jgi:hypothetical protein
MEKLHSAILIILAVFIAGCSADNPVQPVSQILKVEGKVYRSTGYENIFDAGSIVNDAVVDIYQLTDDGTMIKSNTNSASTGSDGKFLMEIETYGTHDLLIIAKKGSRIWKAVLNVIASGEITVFSQPLTIQSTVQAEVYLNAKKNNYNITLFDIALYINPEIAELLYGDPLNIEQLARILHKASEGRATAFLSGYFGGNSGSIEKFNNEAEKLNSKYARDLHFSTSAKNIKALSKTFYESYLDAFLNSGLKKEKIIELLEVYYMILIKSDAGSEELTVRNIKSAAYLKAMVNSSSIISDFQLLNGSKKIKEIKHAGENLLNSIKSADNYGKIKKSFKQFNDLVILSVLNIAGVNGNLKKNIEFKIMSGLNKLIADISASNSNAELIRQAYLEFYSEVSSEVNILLKQVYKEKSTILTGIIILTYLNF